ncbi:hypothetical protein [Puia sp.]|uniref:hypothetical protein n=1 Tax=Puia sp. TaxID=2045100 RepID=UPI002F3FD7AD
MSDFAFFLRMLLCLVYLGYAIGYYWVGSWLAGTALLMQTGLGFIGASLALSRTELFTFKQRVGRMEDTSDIPEFRRPVGIAFSIIAIIGFSHDNPWFAMAFWLMGLLMTSPLDRLIFVHVPQGYSDGLSSALFLSRCAGVLTGIVVATIGVREYSFDRNVGALAAAVLVLLSPVVLLLKGNPQYSKKLYYRNAKTRAFHIQKIHLRQPYFDLLIHDFQVEWFESRDYWQQLEQNPHRDQFKAEKIAEVLAYAETIKKQPLLQSTRHPDGSILDEIADTWRVRAGVRSLFEALDAWAKEPGSPKASGSKKNAGISKMRKVFTYVAEYRAMIKLTRVIRHRDHPWPVEWPVITPIAQPVATPVSEIPSDGASLPTMPPRPQAFLTDEMYYQIIDYIIRLGKNLEHYMDLNDKFNEQGYRDYFLPFLNAVSRDYTAKGEVFNRRGKTDILVCDNDGNNIFIAECKLWNGETHLLAGVDQLLHNYINWRDEKAAIIVFNQSVRNFTGLMTTATGAMARHPLYKALAGKRDPASWSYLFRHPVDAARTIRLELILFNLT